jgi:MFS family permease
MSKRTERRGISRVNAIIVGALLAGALAALVAGHGYSAFTLAFMAAIGLGGALQAARPSASDVTRINGLEYRDERDGTLAQQGFAVVGVAALVLTAGVFLVMTMTGAFHWYVWAQMFVLAGVWAVANWVAVRRS